MTVEHGRIEGDLTLDYRLTLHGMVTGNLAVMSGGFLALHGMCCHNLVVETGGQVYLHGMVCGNVLNHGGHIEIYGMVLGHVYTSEGGQTIIDHHAIVKEGIRGTQNS